VRGTVVGNTADEGGGIYTYASYSSGPSPTLSATLIDSTVAGNVGGGIENDNDGLLALTNSTVTRNIGDGIRDGGFGGLEGSATLVRSRVTRNTGVGIGPSSPFALIDSRVTDNGGE